MKNLREAVQQDDIEKIKSLSTELQQTLYTIGSNIYQGAGAEGGATPPGGDGEANAGTAPSGDDVIDAEFSEDK